MLNKLNTKALGVALLCLLSALVLNHFNKTTITGLCKKAERRLHAKEKLALEGLDVLEGLLQKETPARLFSMLDGSLQENYDREKIAFFAFDNDSLSFWTSSEVPVEDNSLTFIEEGNGLKHLRNGWYEFFYKRAGKYDVLCFILIKPDYDVQNHYLDNSFADWLKLPSSVKLKYPVIHPELAVKSVKEKPLFELEAYDSSVYSKTTSYIAVLLFFISFFAFILAGLRAFLSGKFSLTGFIIVSLVIVGLRALMIWFNWPGLLYQTELFDVNTYGNGQSFFNVLLGDILINVLLFFVWSYVFYKRVVYRFNSNTQRILALSLFILFLFGLAFQLNTTIEGLVTNSTISFEFSNFFSLSGLSFLCLAIVLINGISIALLVEKFFILLFDLHKKARSLFLVAVLLIYCAFYFVYPAWRSNESQHMYTFAEWSWFPLILIVSYFIKRYGNMRSVISAGIRLMLFSVIVSYLFSYYNSLNEEQKLEVLSEQLLDKQDPILENSFAEVSRKMEKDKDLERAMKRLPLFSAQTEQQIRQAYFTGYFEKYNIQLSVFDSLCMPYFRNSDLRLSNNEFFEDRIESGIPIRENLFFDETDDANTTYIGKITFGEMPPRKPMHTLYVMLSPKQFADEGSFPDLLLDKSQQKQSKYKEFSYAVYKKRKLSATYGDFDDYPMYYGAEPSFANLHPGYRHYFFKGQDDSYVIVTTRVKDFRYYFTINSYYFLFFSLVSLLVVLGYSVINHTFLDFFTLSRRIQLFIVSILFFALLAVGIFSIRLVSGKFEENNAKQLSSKARRISDELGPLLFNTQKLDVNSKFYAETILKRYAALFNSDISLYNEKGFLFASSQPLLFETGLSSRLVNPSAVSNFKTNRASYFSTRENIGALNYLSLYTAIYNMQGKFLGYINLPYFARQSNLEKELSEYISTLLNIYVVLFLVSLFTGLIVSTYITKPLRIIQSQIAKISLGQKNESISWQSNDEIGKLVNEYNQMLLKLEESAGLLARSEREGAWREMAKQVAHEIKNPLTPMKLNLQYLQKLASENEAGFREKFKTVSASIIEQIDTLANIANEFSNFAKMPKGYEEDVNLVEIVRMSLELFKNQGSAQFSFDSFSEQVMIRADKNQCLRVFNNIVKNALQSVPEDRQGQIHIRIVDEGADVLVSVRDNGCGISEAMREKIFVPNFTTKSTGTGLGLAMVKNIINSIGGIIWFDSQEGVGTVFYIKFPKKQV